MQPGGNKDFGWVKITMTAATHKSTCIGSQGTQIPGGCSSGFIFNIEKYNLKIYHAGDTAVFSDMAIIDDLYEPDVILIPVGGSNTMTPEQAAFALKNYFHCPKIVIPLYVNNPADKSIHDFDFENFVSVCKKAGIKNK